MVNSENSSRNRYIGGSDMGMVYGSYDADGFALWWADKMTGLRVNNYSSLDMIVGTILEGEILDCLKIPLENRSGKYLKEGTISGVNLDAESDELVIEIKTMKLENLAKLVFGYAMPIGYKRQVYHAMWVTGKKKATITFYPITDELINNPFIPLESSDTITFELSIDEFDIPGHVIRIGFLSECCYQRRMPSNDLFELYKMNNV